MKKYLAVIIVVLAAIVGYWLVMPYFTTVVVNDAMPVVAVSDPGSDEVTPIVSSSSIIDTAGHPASGEVLVIARPGEPTIVRFENYVGTNGPDLFVYLAKDLDATEFISLGRAKGNEGNSNYEVPADVDISEYKYVMTWCRLFGVLFDYAEIN